MAVIYDLADTWNDGATTFTAIKMDVTDTASASGSLLMDLQVGGSSKFSVTKAGVSVLPARSTYAFATSGGYSVGLYSLANYTASLAMAGSPGAAPSPYKGFEFGLTGPTLSMGLTTLDVKLTRDAANTLAQRNSTNAQTFNLYNTYTDASNYERGFMKWDGNRFVIGTEAAGTGAVRDLDISNGHLLRFKNGNFGLLYAQINQTLSITAQGSGTLILGGTTGGASSGAVSIPNTSVTMAGLPTSDPVSAGQLWNDAGTLKISAG